MTSLTHHMTTTVDCVASFIDSDVQLKLKLVPVILTTFLSSVSEDRPMVAVRLPQILWRGMRRQRLGAD